LVTLLQILVQNENNSFLNYREQIHVYRYTALYTLKEGFKSYVVILDYLSQVHAFITFQINDKNLLVLVFNLHNINLNNLGKPLFMY
jgi:hypothetical protein